MTEFSMDDIIPASEDPANQAPPDMSTMEGHEDSRTAVAGRKRDFEETTETPITEGEPSRKRAREDEHTSSLEDGETSISPVPVLADETGDLSQLPTAQASVFTMLKTDSEEGQASVQAPADAPRPPSTRTWNTGVQSGLRTSFAAKGKGRAFLPPDLVSRLDSMKAQGKAALQADRGDEGDGIIIELSDSPTDTDDHPKKKRRNRVFKIGEYDTRDPFIDDSELVLPTANLPGSEAQSGASASAEPFRKLSKTQAKKLPKDQRDAYRRELTLWENSQAQANQATNVSEDEQDGSDEDEDDDIDDYYATDLQLPQIPSHITPEMLAAIGPAPIPPPPFQKLSKSQKKRLSKKEHRQYIQAAKSWGTELSRYRNALRDYKAKLGISQPFRTLPPDFRTNLKRLTKREISELSMQDQVIYAEVFGAHWTNNKLGRRDKASEKAKAVLEQIKQWPLPQGYNDFVANSIRKGKTWYPTSQKKKGGSMIRPYLCKGQSFSMDEIFDVDGLPLAFQHMSFNVFVHHFLTNNRHKWDYLNESNLKGAFNQYLLMFYMHCVDLMPSVKASADAADAITFQQAKQNISASPALSGSSSANTAAAPRHSDTNMIATTSLVIEDQKAALPQETGIDIAMAEAAHTSRATGKAPIHSKEVVLDISMTDDTPSACAAEKAPVQSIVIIGDADVLEAHMLLQQKYYPSASNAIRCLTCGKIGHVTDTCPSLNCLTCGIQGQHSTMMCPRDMPCNRCREHGHTQDDCQERLAMPTSEMACDLCQARSHLETECPQIWRSFDPSPVEILVVNDIPVHCYTCGGSGHYGPDCGLFTGGRSLAGNYTWTKDNLFMYLDPSSRYRAISAGIDYSLPPKQSKNHSYSIKGKANNPISLDSEDDDEEFIRPSVLSGNVPRGNINFGNGQPPQAPFRSGGQGQMSVSIRGPQGKRGGKNSGPGGNGNRNQAANLPNPPNPQKRNRKPKTGGRGGRAGEAPGRR